MVPFVGRAIQPALQVVLRSRNCHAAEHRDRASRGDGQRPHARLRVLQLLEREHGRSRVEVALDACEDRDDAVEQERQQRQQRNDQGEVSGDGGLWPQEQDERRDRQADRPDDHAKYGPAARRSLGRGGESQRTGENSSQWCHHPDERGQQAGADRQRHRGPGDDPLRADWEREREVAGLGVERLDRQDLADEQPERACQHPDDKRVERQRLDGHRAGGAPAAHRLDHAAPLRHGEQHRAQREQEPDDCADSREEALALLRRRRSDREERRVKVGGLEVQMLRRGEFCKARANLGTPSRPHLHEHARHPSPHAADPLGVGDGRKRDLAVDQRADIRFLQCRPEDRSDDVGADLQLDRPRATRASR